MLHLVYKSKPLTKNGISCPNQDASLHWKAFYTVNFRQLFLISEIHMTVMWPALFEQALTSVLSKSSGGKWAFEIEAQRRMILRAKEII